ncbi:DEAD/DEAH box helicase [Agromyces soli]
MPVPAASDDWRTLIDGLTLGATGSTGPSRAGRAASSDAGAGESAPPRAPLALQFELRHRLTPRPGQWQGPKDEPATRPEAVDRLAVRPVTQSARGAWVKQGLTWQNIAYQGEAGGYDPAQARWFAQFALLKGGNPGVYNPYGSAWITLDEYESPLLWALLAEAGRLGIALAGSDAIPTVHLAGEATIGFDARRAAGASVDDALRLAPVSTFDGEGGPLVATRAIGQHGLYRFDFDRGRLELGRIHPPLTAAQRDLLASPRELVVPGAELDEFERVGFHALAAAVPIASADGSFEPPPHPAPVLVLDVRYEPGDVVRLAWRWQWADGGIDEATMPGPGESSHDDDLLARVADLLGWVPFEAVILRGIDAARFVAERLGEFERLAELRREAFRIEVRGERPDYRELLDPPELRVTAVDAPKTDWLELGYMLTVGGRPVPFMPLFRALVKGQKRLLLVDKSYLSLELPVFDELRELIAEAEGLEEWEAGLRLPREQALTLYADFEDAADASPEARAWRDLVAGLEPGQAPPVAQPESIALPLRPYQLEGFRWLAQLWAHGLGGVLADDMGLGKTAQTLALVAHAVSVGRVAPDEGGRVSRPGAGSRYAPSSLLDQREASPFLVVAPTSVASNWVREAARFAPGLRVAAVTATERGGRRSIADAAAGADLVVTTYAVLRLEARAFAALEWGGLVLDEAQFVKNPKTRVHEAARGIRSPFKLALTGTPIENHLGELWAILRIVAPGLFPSRRAFDERFRRPIEDDGNTERLELLRRRVRPLMLRRTKELVAPELPEKQQQVLAVELTPEHRRLYDVTLQRERQKLLDLVKDDSGRFILYRSLTLLRMLALDPALIDPAHEGIGSAKLDALVEQLDDVLAEGHQALVFSQFTSFLGRAAARLEQEGVPVALLDGSTPTARRDAEVARFRSGEASVFLISLKAGGFGLNLVEADYVFLLDPWWNPASEEQAIDRAHRLGQSKQVMVYRLVAEGTIEEKVMQLKAKKGELVAGVLAGRTAAGAGDDAAESGAADLADADFGDASFSVEELRSLLER